MENKILQIKTNKLDPDLEILAEHGDQSILRDRLCLVTFTAATHRDANGVLKQLNAPNTWHDVSQAPFVSYAKTCCTNKQVDRLVHQLKRIDNWG